MSLIFDDGRERPVLRSPLNSPETTTTCTGSGEHLPTIRTDRGRPAGRARPPESPTPRPRCPVRSFLAPLRTRQRYVVTSGCSEDDVRALVDASVQPGLRRSARSAAVTEGLFAQDSSHQLSLADEDAELVVKRYVSAAGWTATARVARTGSSAQVRARTRPRARSGGPFCRAPCRRDAPSFWGPSAGRAAH